MYECGQCDYMTDSERGLSIHKSMMHKESITKECKICDNEFTVSPSRDERIIYCSESCRKEGRSKSMSGKNHPNWTEYPTTTCEICGMEYEVIPARLDETRFCSRKCQAKYRSQNKSGKNSHFWKGGCKRYYGPSWNRKRRETQKRDVICQECGEDGTNQILDVHHIIPVKEFDNIDDAHYMDNLILLCRNCHMEKHPK